MSYREYHRNVGAKTLTNVRFIVKDITQYILAWTSCCNEIWDNWFCNVENGEDEFLEVEEVLFSSLVLSQLSLENRPNLDDCYKLLRARYKTDGEEQRSVCRLQKSGTIYCQRKTIKFKKDNIVPIKSIDVMGTMLNRKPYVEIKLNNDEYLLEPIENVKIEICINA